ncbi:MAG: hypothetical protein H6568_03990 [Lewinellaceae bacterium]|nr:hypothetical protein [Saprospiraceae bacterium]MCB9311901.1 hypothetical protein [Lewinellaceae bacterium]HRW74493.1 hypothetical protein [Saprospiraceae bacterium]
MDSILTRTRLRWIARILSLALFFLWGAFFLEHLSWFQSFVTEPPPLMVWVMQLAHLTLLLGYLFAWRSERVAVLMILIGAGIFFPFVGGPNAWWYGLTAIVPAIFFFLAWRSEPEQ